MSSSSPKPAEGEGDEAAFRKAPASRRLRDYGARLGDIKEATESKRRKGLDGHRVQGPAPSRDDESDGVNDTDEDSDRPAETSGSEEDGDRSGSDEDADKSGSDEDAGDKAECRSSTTAFGRAFNKILKKRLPNTSLTDAMGPVLSAHKQLITKKLEEAASDRKAKSESKKEKQALREKGHTVPVLYPTAQDRELIKLATRGVVKLFNAVSKAQSIQEASKDLEAKEVVKRSKSTFLTVLQGGNGPTEPTTISKQSLPVSDKERNDVKPRWSALQDTFMLGKSRLKDWDTEKDVEIDGQTDDQSDGDSFSD